MVSPQDGAFLTLADNKFKFGGYSWRIFACAEYNGFGAKLWRKAAV